MRKKNRTTFFLPLGGFLSYVLLVIVKGSLCEIASGEYCIPAAAASSAMFEAKITQVTRNC